MTSFDIRPYEGALPLTFGMSVDSVHGRLGTPERVSRIWDNTGHTHYWHNSCVNFAFDNDGRLKHCGFGPGAYTLSLNGTNIWLPDSHADPNPILLSLDPQPLEYVGFLIFLQLGVTTTGYHDDDPGQHAVTAFVRGDYDEMIPEATQPDLSPYR